MSPTLLESVVAVLLVGLAWYIAVHIAPELIDSLLAYWRGPKLPPSSARWPSEKNVTPPKVIDPSSPDKHAPHHE